MPHDAGVLRVWAGAAGICLWAPAVALPGLPLPLQPLDLLVVGGLPLVLLNIRRLPALAGWIGLTFLCSVWLSFSVMGGNGLVLTHAVVLALGFLGLMASVAGAAAARRAFITGFLLGSAGSALLFFAQIGIGADHLDFRTNTAFSLPPQFRRGFALMPEVSTFATHAAMALAICVGLLLHPGGTAVARRGVMMALAGLLCAALMISRSSSFLIIMPALCLIAVTQARRLDLGMVLRLMLIALVLSVLLGLFFNLFYADRVESASAARSASMRLASVLGGLSPLWTGEIFGVGLGDNFEIQRRAFDIGRALGLNFGQLPQGVNSQIVARIFEEGWPAVLNLTLGAALLARILLQRHRDPVVAALAILAAGSFLTALCVTGYRGIYTNWLWLALPAVLVAAPRRGSATVGERAPA